jgi:DNA-binding transcriptional regulator GbsR (MarR family)
MLKTGSTELHLTLRTSLNKGVREMELCRCSYLIMGILRAANAADRVHGLTISEICGFERQSKPNTIHKKMKELESSGLVCEGVKSGRAKTYYLTGAGVAILPEKQIKQEREENYNEE